MSQEYYFVEKNNNIGKLNIGLQVFETIVYEAIEKVTGVKLNGNTGISMPGSKAPILVKVNKSNQITIDVELVVDYGLNVTSISNVVQTDISNAILEMTGLKSAKINVIISGVNF